MWSGPCARSADALNPFTIRKAGFGSGTTETKASAGHATSVMRLKVAVLASAAIGLCELMESPGT